MEFKWKQKEVTLDGSPLKISIPTVEMDAKTKQDVAKTAVGLALGGVSGAVAMGGVLALDEWKALNGSRSGEPSRSTTPLTPRSRDQVQRRCRVVTRRTLPVSREEKIAARNNRRARERLLMQQMSMEARQMNSVGHEPRGRYQPDSPSVKATSILRSRSLPELGLEPASSPDASPVAASEPPLTPRQQRLQRERALMEQMAEMKRQEQHYDCGEQFYDGNGASAEMAAEMEDTLSLGSPARGLESGQVLLDGGRRSSF